MNIRSKNEIEEAEKEFFEKVWFVKREWNIADMKSLGTAQAEMDEYLETIRPKQQEITQKYGRKNLIFKDEMNWGLTDGRLSGLRWVLGKGWDISSLKEDELEKPIKIKEALKGISEIKQAEKALDDYAWKIYLMTS
jgi:hypothetical protein